MKRPVLSFGIAAVLGLALWGCSETLGPADIAGPEIGNPMPMIHPPLGTPLTTTFYAGQHIDVGDVTISDNDVTLRIVINLEPGWVITETHIAVDNVAAQLPQNQAGNPRVGHFEYEAAYEDDEWWIDVDMIGPGYNPDGPLYIAVHAVVEERDENGNTIRQETAWADGSDFPGNSWATYVQYHGAATLTVGLPEDGSIDPEDTVPISWNHPITIPEEVEAGIVLLDLLYEDEEYPAQWNIAFEFLDPGTSIGDYLWTVGCYPGEDRTSFRVQLSLIVGELDPVVIAVSEEITVWDEGCPE